VINYDDDDCHRPKQIESGLPLSIPEPRIEIKFQCWCLFARHTK
jgi:hypothetical protein